MPFVTVVVVATDGELAVFEVTTPAKMLGPRDNKHTPPFPRLMLLTAGAQTAQ